MTSAHELVQALYNEQQEYHAHIIRAVEKWVEESRKYPNGFQFMYNNQKLSIANATCSYCMWMLDEGCLTEENLRIVYVCAVHDNKSDSNNIKFIRVGECAVGKALGEELHKKGVAQELVTTYELLLQRQEQEKAALIEEWVERNREYPNGFKFEYNGNAAVITGAECTVELDELLEVPLERIYISYLCLVEGWALNPSNPNDRIRVAEFTIQNHLKNTNNAH